MWALAPPAPWRLDFERLDYGLAPPPGLKLVESGGRVLGLGNPLDRPEAAGFVPSGSLPGRVAAASGILQGG